ncbi:creatininase family protein [Candidatus Aerophobetes bacterium]|nr:creatininase family protein [Candidatus Aerophobetes bacterium]
MWITTDNPAIIFENSDVGRLKKKLWDASEEEIEAILKEYDIPSPPELSKPGTYIQTTVREELIKNRRKNDIVFIPIGCTENHGRHTVSGLDTFMVTQILEALRRYTVGKGKPINLAFPPLNYGSHPYHHIGMPGNVIMPQEVTREVLINVMLGLWNDGFRKQIIVNNHGHLWVLETALHEFLYRYQLPGVFQIVDWHRAVREFFFPGGKSDLIETPFIHADEAETSVGLLLFPEGMIKMDLAQEAEPKALLPAGHFDNAIDSFHRPHRWSEGEGHNAIEIAATPEGVVGKPTIATAKKAKRPIAAILRYLTLVTDQILQAFPAGTVPPVEQVTLRTAAEMEPYLKEPGSLGWKSVYCLRKIGF